MLYEIKNIKQHKNEGLRRWFTDGNFDLIIWYDVNNKSIDGFQLCYDKSNYERALTWMKDKNIFFHNKIDDGEIPGTLKQTPILVEDGLFDKNKIAEKFKIESNEIDKKVANFVYKKILGYFK